MTGLDPTSDSAPAAELLLRFWPLALHHPAAKAGAFILLLDFLSSDQIVHESCKCMFPVSCWFTLHDLVSVVSSMFERVQGSSWSVAHN